MNNTAYRVPFSRPHTGEEEIDAIAAVVRSGWLTTGPQAAKFESEFASYIGSTNALAVSSCTAGLHLAMSALDIGVGDEVITTPLTYCATVQAIEETGATVVFCDIGSDLNIDPSCLPGLLTNRTRAIIPVHIAGLPCRMDEIWSFADRHGLSVIEDAAHAIGSAYRGSLVGCGKHVGCGQSDATVFSFFANKNMTTGEGGMITSPDTALLARMRQMSRHGVLRSGDLMHDSLPWFYEVVDRGLKCNLSDLQAAIGRVQLQKLDSMIAKRTEIALRYSEAFHDCDAIELSPQDPTMRHSWHLYIIRLNLENLTIDRDQFTRELRKRGVECSVHFIPIPLHPYYRDRFPDQTGYQEALRQFPRLLSLPLYPGLSDSQVDLVINAIMDLVSTGFKSKASFRLHETAV